MLPQYCIKTPPWRTNSPLEHLMSILISKGISAKIVGGAVRDAITGTFSQRTDIDLAIDVPPEEVQKKLKNFRTIPTGISHGTLTVLIETQTFEITSLRRDISTDGRHATVEYTKDFLEDAKRRDFTINALYADFDGKVYDPLNQGLKDLTALRIRFVGNSEERIKEDFLRIVRFFRFMGYFKSVKIYKEDLKIARELSHNLNQISKERLWGELQKIISSPFPINTIEALIQNDIMKHVCRGEWDLDNLKKINDWLPHIPDTLFTVLSVGYKSNFTTFPLPIPSKLRHSLCKNQKLDLEFSPQTMYRMGKEAYKDQFISSYIQTYPFTQLDYETLLNTLRKIDSWQFPTFPLSGNTLLEKGVIPGRKMGEMLKYLENWWIDKDFKPTKVECLRELEKSYGAKLH